MEVIGKSRAFLEKSCLQKEKKTKKQAESTINKYAAKGIELRKYQCRYCKWWHLTSYLFPNLNIREARKSAQRSITRERQAKIDAVYAKPRKS